MDGKLLIVDRDARQARWEKRDAQAWDAAAATLKANGYTQQNRANDIYPATFHKSGQPTLVLVRDLGVLNWHPREM